MSHLWKEMNKRRLFVQVAFYILFFKMAADYFKKGFSRFIILGNVPETREIWEALSETYHVGAYWCLYSFKSALPQSAMV